MFLPPPYISLSFSRSPPAPWRIALLFMFALLCHSCSPCSVVHVLTSAINSSIFLSISSSSMTYRSVSFMFALFCRSCSPCSVVHVLTSAMNSSIFLSISSSSMTYRSVSFMLALFWNILTCFSVASNSSWNFFFLSRSCLLYMSCSLFNFVSLRHRYIFLYAYLQITGPTIFKSAYMERT